MEIEINIAPDGRLTVSGSEEWSGYFASGNGAGLLALLRRDPPAETGSGFQFFRRAARELPARLLRTPEGELCERFRRARPESDLLDRMLFERPPMSGGEFLNRELLERLFLELEEAALADITASGLDVESWVRSLGPDWKEVGKVGFHLAENRNDRDGTHPFLFLATFIHRPGEGEKPRHLPLGAALKAFAGERGALLTLLRPVRLAAESSALIAALTADDRIYRPVELTAGEAFQFLEEIPCFEQAGITVRMVNLWKRRPRRLQLEIAVETLPGFSFLNTRSLLNFSIRPTLGGVPVSDGELQELLRSPGGLVRFKGEWVEADPGKIAALLKVWRAAAGRFRATGLSFADGVRLLAGVPAEARAGAPPLPEPDPELCRVTAVGELERLLCDLGSPARIPLPELPESFHAVLRPYQLDGVRFLWRLGALGLGGCLADDMGLGKTLQMLAFLELLRVRGELLPLPALLVAPASLLANWREEAARFTPQLRFGVLHPAALGADSWRAFRRDPAGFLSRFDLAATTYQMVTRLPELAEMEFPAVIADEAQAIKNPGSRQSRAVRFLRGKRRFALTGTPVENRLADLWSLFDFLNPGLLGNRARFEEFRSRLEEKHDNYAPLRRLVAPYILRRLKSDRSVIRDLPDKSERTVFCRLTPAQAVLYSRAVEAMKRELDTADGVQRKGVVLKYLTQFKQICNHPAQYTGTGEYDPAGSGKFERLSELAELIAARREKVLVFTQFREMIEPIAELLSRGFGRSGVMLHGGTPLTRRAELVEQFQRESGPPFFVLSLKAAGTGLNLTAASHVIHFDRWWNPAVENQATDRAYRIGQHRNVQVHKFLCGGTVEERINALIWSKRRLADSVIGSGGEVTISELTDSELLELVRLDIRDMEV